MSDQSPTEELPPAYIVRFDQDGRILNDERELRKVLRRILAPTEHSAPMPLQGRLAYLPDFERIYDWIEDDRQPSVDELESIAPFVGMPQLPLSERDQNFILDVLASKLRSLRVIDAMVRNAIALLVEPSVRRSFIDANAMVQCIAGVGRSSAHQDRPGPGITTFNVYRQVTPKLAGSCFLTDDEVDRLVRCFHVPYATALLGPNFFATDAPSELFLSKILPAILMEVGRFSYRQACAPDVLSTALNLGAWYIGIA